MVGFLPKASISKYNESSCPRFDAIDPFNNHHHYDHDHHHSSVRKKPDTDRSCSESFDRRRYDFASERVKLIISSATPSCMGKLTAKTEHPTLWLNIAVVVPMNMIF